ncbi:MAG: T9SS type A sorting domain-containing protein [Ignavibacteria bacterium]|nr:T9SS type A sorting domain-containing protein [Ignavibacteria bacterium]
MKITQTILLTIAFFFTIKLSNSQWIVQSTGTNDNMSGVACFPSIPVTLMTGGQNIFKTTNNGTNWINISYPAPTTSLQDVIISGTTTAWACGNGRILKSTNSGSNWAVVTAPNRYWNSGYFLNDNTGWFCGGTDTVIKTTNGGTNWTVQENNLYPGENNYGIVFANSLLGLMVGSYDTPNAGYILKTINGGGTWLTVFTANSYIHSITMVNSTTGFAGGTGKVYKTTNSGSNWTETSISGAGALYTITFPVDTLTGYAAGLVGKMYKTTNGGNNWYPLTTGVTGHFRGMDFSFGSSTTGYAVGTTGVVLRTTNGGGTFVEVTGSNTSVPANYSLHQNYPNPFNPETNITYNIPKKQFVKLAVYDVAGREIGVLVDENKEPGSYSIHFSSTGLASGIYFYRLTAGSFSQTKKMSIIK